MPTAKTTYSSLMDDFAYLWDFYRGGKYVKYPSATTLSNVTITKTSVTDEGEVKHTRANVSSYLIPHEQETGEHFGQRVAFSSYINLPKIVVDTYTDAVCSRIKRDFGSMTEYMQDINGNSWGDIVERVARYSALYGFCFLFYEFASDMPIITKADLIEAKPSVNAVVITPPQTAWVISCSRGSIKEIAWVEEAYVRDDLGGKQYVKVRVVNADTWKVIDGIFNPASKSPIWEQLDNVVEEGTMPGRIPVQVCYYTKDDSTAHPYGISLVGDVVDAARAVFNILSWTLDILHKTGVPVLAMPVSMEAGKMSKDAKITIGTGAALPYPADTSAPQWIAPPVTTTQELRAQADYYINTAMRSVGLATAVDNSAQVQSGEALRIRTREFESKCKKFAQNLASFEQRVLKDLAAMAGMEYDAVVTYPQVYAVPATKEDLTNAITILDKLGSQNDDIKQAAIRQILSAGLSLSDQSVDEIMAEIDLKEDMAETPSPKMEEVEDKKEGINDE